MIVELRILPPLAIGRLGSAQTPLDNFSIEMDSKETLGYRRIVPAPTLHVDDATGAISSTTVPSSIEFKTKDQQIRPVAPFLEVWAREEGAVDFVPLTVELLSANGLGPQDVEWTVRVENRKVERRTGDPDDRVQAKAGPFTSHDKQALRGTCRNFRTQEHVIAFGNVRYIKPTPSHPEIRLRFTPAKGLIYGANVPVHEIEEIKKTSHVSNFHVVEDELAVYRYEKKDDEAEKDERKARWWKFSIPATVRNADPDVDTFYNETQPPALFAILPPAPCWLNGNEAVSRGYLDDACDGVVEARLTQKGRDPLCATSRIVAAPPALVPDSLFVRSLADDLDQVIFGPDVPADEGPGATQARAEDIVRRAYETVRFLNVAVMNGNWVDGRNPLDIDTMPAEEAYDVWRMMRPVFTPHAVDTLAIVGLHQRVYASMRGGAAPWFPALMRKPDQVADFTDTGRRKMPALMCGADGNYLALTHRQIDTIAKASVRAVDAHPLSGTIEADAERTTLIPRNASARRAAELHYVAAGNPVSSRPVMAIGNCTPGLEMDFRAVWRRVFAGIVLREYDNLVMEIEDPRYSALKDRRLQKVEYTVNGEVRSFLTQTTQIGPSPADPDGQSVVLSFEANPHGLAPLEWSNLLARMLHERAGQTVTCHFTTVDARLGMVPWEEGKGHAVEMTVRPFFENDGALISTALAEPGELTQGLCSPWQNDYRECSCYYWASARPDFVNIEPGRSGLTKGDNWLQKVRTGSYVPDDYVDERLILYDDLFNEWEQWLRFAIKGRDADHEPAPTGQSASSKGTGHAEGKKSGE